MMSLSPPQRYLITWISLLLLLALTGIVAYINLGWGNTVISIGIAAIKAIIIAVVFMHVLKGDSALRLTIALPLFLFFLLTFLSMADYMRRDAHPAPWRSNMLRWE